MQVPHIKRLASGFVLLATGFTLGTIYANWSYDYFLLWTSPSTPEMIETAVRHYSIKATQPMFLHHVLHFFLALAVVSLVAKLYRPTESNTLFDGGSLVLYVTGIIFYLTNLRPAGQSVATGDWNDIDEETGVKLISATQVLIVFVLLGVVALQFGQSWVEQDMFDAVIAEAADENAQVPAAEAPVAEAGEAAKSVTSKSTGTDAARTTRSRKA